MKTPREPVNTYTHAAGALLALAALAWLVALAWPDPRLVAGAVVFGVTMFLMYAASAGYHAARLGERGLAWLRKLDHAAIFLFIAGSYTPVLLTRLDGVARWGWLGLVWGLAALGIALKLWKMTAPRWLSTLSYLGLGWLAVFLVPQLQLPPAALGWLLASGALYSVGALVYALKRPNFRGFGFHELWHLFVLGGSATMFAAVWVLFAASS
ncbi:PAQR family membrane homeostasis protein TrhA [Oceanithermus profundus]|uniref:Channel protein, hemolysin III family n=1 Tax=Oceanithermus profundus (strain DSM 14977 / NBRC 100410 / VKM B-2274 / 506) TaxID=670487 RepID=E4U4P0_OCEP5|nr:hemolysin III family protein [Oceanithermus profundus]ADR37033.1 channel protein, hemolysin III family [Oceanithermus profundus DSM 14977]